MRPCCSPCSAATVASCSRKSGLPSAASRTSVSASSSTPCSSGARGRARPPLRASAGAGRSHRSPTRVACRAALGAPGRPGRSARPRSSLRRTRRGRGTWARPSGGPRARRATVAWRQAPRAGGGRPCVSPLVAGDEVAETAQTRNSAIRSAFSSPFRALRIERKRSASPKAAVSTSRAGSTSSPRRRGRSAPSDAGVGRERGRKLCRERVFPTPGSPTTTRCRHERAANASFAASCSCSSSACRPTNGVSSRSGSCRRALDQPDEPRAFRLDRGAGELSQLRAEQDLAGVGSLPSTRRAAGDRPPGQRLPADDELARHPAAHRRPERPPRAARPPPAAHGARRPRAPPARRRRHDLLAEQLLDRAAVALDDRLRLGQAAARPPGGGPRGRAPGRGRARRAGRRPAAAPPARAPPPAALGPLRSLRRRARGRGRGSSAPARATPRSAPAPARPTRAAPPGRRPARRPAAPRGRARASAADASARGRRSRGRAPRARPRARRANLARAPPRSRSSSAARRSSSSRRASVCANDSNARSASGEPRQSCSASRSAAARSLRSRLARLLREPLEAAGVDRLRIDTKHVPRGPGLEQPPGRAPCAAVRRSSGCTRAPCAAATRPKAPRSACRPRRPRWRGSAGGRAAHAASALPRAAFAGRDRFQRPEQAEFDRVPCHRGTCRP